MASPVIPVIWALWLHYHFEDSYVRIKHHKVGFNFFVYRNPLGGEES